MPLWAHRPHQILPDDRRQQAFHAQLLEAKLSSVARPVWSGISLFEITIGTFAGVAPAQHSQPRQHESKAPVHDAQQPPLHQAGPLQQPCAVSSAPAASSKPLDVVSRQLPGALASTGGSNDLFWSLFGQQDAHDTFWLDRYPGSEFL